MRPRLLRRFLLRQLKTPDKPTRTFTHNSPALYNARPQLPFLYIPSRFQRQQWRYLTTERKIWLRREAILSVKYTAYFWAILACIASAAFAVQQEFLERQFPTPHEWSFRTRMLKRGAEAEKNRPDVVTENWALVSQMLKDTISRLEDPTGDGEGLKDMGPESPAGTKDVSAMPEAWRRGYYEALLTYARASEHVQGWVLDKTRKTVFPPDVVRGPSNPFPKPIPPGAMSAPREEDCVSAGFPSPDECYLKLLSTEGFTSKQRMDAALAYANWLEYKGVIGPAAIMYEDAVNLAVEEIYTPGASPLIDPHTAVLSDKADREPSANLITSLTALATFKARRGDESAALPILVSLLKARRSMSSEPPQKSPDEELAALLDGSKKNGPLQTVLNLFKPPPYPPPPSDGTSPPIRDSKGLCEEAALDLHIGEIMYVLKGSAREDGLAWTREGVDLAEEELHKVLQDDKDNREAKKACRECLASGLDNWAAMVNRMVQEEEAAKSKGETKSSAGWFGLWSGGKVAEEGGGRWAAEEKVVIERTVRAKQILEDLEKPNAGLMTSLLRA
ncbi:hypothetical protein UCDDA912_g03261 [Diaporthe ampelina]|uniref:Mfs maltose permease n=1 Tax=Diaporthe ampelina TaxID=1214573 RepID=A0A0G2FRC3_9PEZI|nr:hypothetical protein UCDDA912_g03261 [Diaporthe ampelina]